MKPSDFLALVIDRWEGGYQSYASDSGNWVTRPDGTRIKIGTMRGVTPAALAQHRGIEPWTLTPADMQAVTRDEAVEIGLVHYYREPGLDRLLWEPATAALLDFGWMSGPRQAVLSLQRLVGVMADGDIGPLTVTAYAAWESRLGPLGALEAVHDMRASFYRHLAEINPANGQFVQGWLNRADWASALNPDFARAWGLA